MTVSRTLFSSERTDWGTPPDLFSGLDEIFSFTVDAAASAGNALLPRFWTEEDSGLDKRWAGERVFVNPPYGRGLVGPWVVKAVSQIVNGGADAVVMLLPSRTDSAWFAILRQTERTSANCRMFFFPYRLRFEGASASAPFPSLLAVLTNLWWGVGDRLMCETEALIRDRRPGRRG